MGETEVQEVKIECAAESYIYIYIYVSMEGACESRCVHEDRKESSETDSDLAKR